MVTVTLTSGSLAYEGDTYPRTSDFGRSICVSKNGLNLIVGAPSAYVNNSATGLARVYTYNNSQTPAWNKKGQDLTIAVAGTIGNNNGKSVAINYDGSIIAVSQIYNNEYLAGNFTGQVTVYTYNSQNSNWVKLGNTISPGIANAQFGFSVAMNYDGYIIAVQDVQDGQNVNNTRVYNYNNSGGTWDWRILGSLINSTTYYKSISLSSNGYILAANPTGFNTLADIYTYNNPVWSKKISINLPTNSVSDYSDIDHIPANYFSSISLNSDGTIVAIGNYRKSPDISNSFVRVYKLNYTNNTATLLGSDIKPGSFSVSLNYDGTILYAGGVSDI